MESNEEHWPWCLQMLHRRRAEFLRSDAGWHLLQSRVELLKAVRAIIDMKIDRIERFGKSAEAKEVDIE
jgi:hypothetical protein